MCVILLCKRFHNSFVILVIHKFCYFNLVVSSPHCNHQYHADFDICHDFHGLIIVEYVPHLPEEVPSYIIVISGTHHHTRLLKQKGKCVFAKRIKVKMAQKLPRRWRWWRTSHCYQSSSVSPPTPRWRHSPWYSSHRTHAIWRVLMTLGWAARRSAPHAHQWGTTPDRCTIGCATPLHTSFSRTLTQCQSS
jgi:hypothetical protein